MSATALPETTVQCSGCDEPLSLLTDHLHMIFKPVRGVLVSTEVPAEDSEIPSVEYTVGSKSGRGVVARFHGFGCLNAWTEARKTLKPKLEYHYEEGDPYVPDDNRTPEELVDAGEMPEEFLAFHEAVAEFLPASAEGDENDA